MGKITVETCEIEGLKILTPQVFGDNRGYFMETYNYNDYKAAGIGGRSRKPSANGMACFFPKKTKSSFSFRRILHTVF